MSIRRCIVGLAIAISASTSVSAQTPALTPRSLETALAARPQGADAEQLAARIRTTFGAEALARGPAPQIDELTVAWALELPQAPLAQARPPRVASDTGGFNVTLTRVGTTNVYAATATLSHGASDRVTAHGSTVRDPNEQGESR